ncbi:hypothetical protein D3C76_1017530 [compost metagenome]
MPSSPTATKVRNEVAATARSPVYKFSEMIFTNTSMLVRPVQETKDSKHTESVGRMGLKKSTESVEAVTTLARQWRIAEMEATSSMPLISLPPNNVL